MKTTAENLDQFLREADPVVARTVEDIVNRLLILRPKSASPGLRDGSSAARYRLPSRSLGVREGLELTKLAHVGDG